MLQDAIAPRLRRTRQNAEPFGERRPELLAVRRQLPMSDRPLAGPCMRPVEPSPCTVDVSEHVARRDEPAPVVEGSRDGLTRLSSSCAGRTRRQARRRRRKPPQSRHASDSLTSLNELKRAEPNGLGRRVAVRRRHAVTTPSPTGRRILATSLRRLRRAQRSAADVAPGSPFGVVAAAPSMPA